MINKDACCQFEQIKEIFRDCEYFAVIAHFRPDGDALGSTLALGHALKAMGKQVRMFNDDPVPHQLKFMPGSDEIEITPEHLEPTDVVISLDNGALKRLGDRGMKLAEEARYLINIDHHETNDRFGDVVCVQPQECATCAVLYKLFKHLDIKIDPVMRDALYVGISTDTG